MIDARRTVSEKDEEQLGRLGRAEQDRVRSARDAVRAGVAAGDPLFDPGSEYYALPADAAGLGPLDAD